MKVISAIVLAAGLSTRMGQFKPLMPYQTKKIITVLIETLLNSDISTITVVTGYLADLIKEELTPYAINMVYNPRYNEGMHTSVICGVENIPENSDALMLFLGDQPHISSPLINKLIDFYQLSTKGIIIPSFSHRRGHPIIIDRKYFSDSLNLNSKEGLKQLINDNSYDIDYMLVNDDDVLFDIDTPKDYEELLQRH